MVCVPCFLLLIMVTAMNASRGTMTQIVFMDGRDNGPAMTDLVRFGSHVVRSDASRWNSWKPYPETIEPWRSSQFSMTAGTTEGDCSPVG